MIADFFEVFDEKVGHHRKLVCHLIFAVLSHNNKWLICLHFSLKRNFGSVPELPYIYDRDVLQFTVGLVQKRTVVPLQVPY